ncbi:MAG: hemolysin III family protein [Lachnospiraceae bacterium]|nr:hemolysin III family protein [Lachnospiraceae bacterium]
MSKETFQQNVTHPKDPGSALTHFIGAVLVVLAALPLLVRAVQGEHPVYIVSLCIFAASMFLLYTASTLYHTFNLSAKINLRLKKLDHIMIYVLIAGTYTPVCLITLSGAGGTSLFLLVWGVALLGILQCIFFINCPKWVSALIYIAMGWLCVFSFGDIVELLNKPAFYWLLAGGIIYTIGGIIYACKFPVFNRLHENFGSHEIFHCFVLAGSMCHFVTMYCI